jgi:quercetin dioxygenase-like cupin family protein
MSSSCLIKNFSNPDKVQTVHTDNTMKYINLPNKSKIALGEFKSGFSVNLCNQNHLGYMVEGCLKIAMSEDPSREVTLLPGDYFFIPPDHTSICDKDCKMLFILDVLTPQELTKLKLLQKNISKPDAKRELPNCAISDFKINDRLTLSLGAMKPGWRWSKDVKPTAKTEFCEHEHTGYVLSGSFTITLAESGEKVEAKAGDVFYIPPKHDAWCLPNEGFIGLDFGSLKGYGIEKV